MDLDDGTPLDLTHSVLRSVSPIHREYMRNMKTAASLTVGLAHGQTLWGMLVCHHLTPRFAGPDLRAVADMIGQVVSLLLVSLGEADLFARRHERQATLARWPSGSPRRCRCRKRWPQRRRNCSVWWTRPGWR